MDWDDVPGGVYEPARLGEAIGELLRMPPAISLRHLTVPEGHGRPSA